MKSNFPQSPLCLVLDQWFPWLYINSTYKLSISMDMIVETQVTNFITYNFHRSVNGLRNILSKYVDTFELYLFFVDLNYISEFS